MEDKRAKMPWARWLMLAAAAMDLWLVWSGIRDCQWVAAADIFPPEGFAAWAAGERFQWLIYGTLALTFLFHFITWKAPQRTRPFYIAEGIFLLLLTAAWGTSAFFLPFSLLSSWGKLIWGVMALLLLGGTGHSLWQCHKLRKSDT